MQEGKEYFVTWDRLERGGARSQVSSTITYREERSSENTIASSMEDARVHLHALEDLDHQDAYGKCLSGKLQSQKETRQNLDPF